MRVGLVGKHPNGGLKCDCVLLWGVGMDVNECKGRAQVVVVRAEEAGFRREEAVAFRPD